MTSADVGGEVSPEAALVGVPLVVGLSIEPALAYGDAGKLGDGATGARATVGAAAAAVGGGEIAAGSALGWLTLAEQPASTTATSTTASSTAPTARGSSVPRRYSTGGGYVRCSG